jgi:parvulin-like peptidyl-prolyl isomerase
MFLLDDLLLAPFKGIRFVAESVYDAAEDEIANRRTALRDELNQLYIQLDIGEITEEEFDRREEEVLDALDALEEARSTLGGEDSPTASK